VRILRKFVTDWNAVNSLVPKIAHFQFLGFGELIHGDFALPV
jgi:hypothetical protein